MFGLSIRSLLIGLFALMALIVGGEGLVAINKIAAVNASVVDIATNWLPSIDAVRQHQCDCRAAPRLRRRATSSRRPKRR